MSTATTNTEGRGTWGTEGVSAPMEQPSTSYEAVLSPFTENSLLPASAPATTPGIADAYTVHLASPFAEAAGLQSDVELETEAVQELFAELEDEEFTESVDRLVQEGAARYTLSLRRWAGDAHASSIAASEVEQWLESLAGEVDQRLAELESRYHDRTVESLTEAELEAFGEDLAAGTGSSPLDAQEDFFKKLWRKVKKVARGVVKLARKGVSALSRILPIGRLLSAVRRLVRPLLRRVLKRAIGRLPAPLRPVARKLAKRLGLEAEAEADEQLAELLAEPVSAGEELVSEFDQHLVGYLLAPDAGAAEEEAAAAAYAAAGDAGDPVGALDDARRRLAEYFASAEHQADPTAQMEQFIPAVIPLVKLGLRVVGRKRVVGLIAKLIAKLIRPLVGRRLAPALSRHIAGAGLSLIGLEAEADDPQLGAEALVSVVEDTIREVLSADPEALEDELLASGIVHEAFVDAATRHLPPQVLRTELLDEGEDERGVWVMMPRHAHGPYRYRAYARSVPVMLHRPVARQIIVGEDETLEDRLLEAGAEAFPVRAEVELFETLPGGERDHIAAGELEEDEATGAHEIATELFEMEEESHLNLLIPAHAPRCSGRGAVPRRRQPTRRYARIRVKGVPLRRRSALSLRLDLSGSRPALTVRVRVGERRAHEPAARRVADGVARAFAAQVGAAASPLATAARDPRRGITLTCVLTYPSTAALLTATPTHRTLAVAPGWSHG